MEIKIFGVSEDFIEIQGDIAEEFMIELSYRPEEQFFAFSDGTILSFLFEHDGWSISKVRDGTAQYLNQTAGTLLAKSDAVTLTGDLGWVLKGSEVVFAS